jgi:hypothetical protein
LIAVDSTGLRLSMIDEVAARLNAKAGIERDRLAVTFTHTHTAPKVNGACDTIFSTPIPPEHQAHIDRYTNELTDALEQVALAALNDRRPGERHSRLCQESPHGRRAGRPRPADARRNVGRRRRDPRDLRQLRLPLRHPFQQQSQRRLGRFRGGGSRA